MMEGSSSPVRMTLQATGSRSACLPVDLSACPFGGASVHVVQETSMSSYELGADRNRHLDRKDLPQSPASASTRPVDHHDHTNRSSCVSLSA